MWDFKKWLKIQEASGLSSNDFTSLSQAERMAQGRDIGEPFIKKQLKAHGLNIIDVPSRMDIRDKVDGMLDGKPVQIKLRRSGTEGRNDISFEVCRNHNNRLPLQQQLQNPSQQGRDFKGKVAIYFVMNKDESEIYEIPAEKIKASVNNAISELENSEEDGFLTRSFTASDGTELKPTRDRDPNSFTPFKVMAFIPVEAVVTKKYKIDLNLTDAPQPALTVATTVKSPTLPKYVRPEFIQHGKDALSTGSKTFPIGSTQPQKKAEKISDATKYAATNGLKMTVNPDNTITFSTN